MGAQVWARKYLALATFGFLAAALLGAYMKGRSDEKNSDLNNAVKKGIENAEIFAEHITVNDIINILQRGEY